MEVMNHAYARRFEVGYTPARATIRVVRHKNMALSSTASPCVFAVDTLYCSEEAGLDFSHVVATNVYLDTIDEFPKMNSTYATYFGSAPPTRTTVQPLAPLERKPDNSERWPMLEQISLIAVR
jgi:2-iminobutanoate/2-iminopropanoate deaminase